MWGVVSFSVFYKLFRKKEAKMVGFLLYLSPFAKLSLRYGSSVLEMLLAS